MKDLISRQDAIDLVEKWFLKIGLNGDICLDGLRSLPSAQQWIPCSERLPEERQHVLVTRADNELGDVIWETWWYTQTRFPNKRPVAWMPLPQPWKEVHDEKVH